MNAQEITDAFEFELTLAKLLLRGEPWKHKVKALELTNGGKASVTKAGIVKIPLNNEYDSHALQYELRHLFTDMHCGFLKRKNFCWQRIAKKLGIAIQKEAIDMAECDLCKRLTPLTMTKRCIPCRTLENAIHAAPNLARKILKDMT